jgi:hypothetical protein
MPLLMPPLRRFLPLAAAALVGFAATARAEVFVFKDWVVSCDNTGGCEAAGFRAEGSASQPVMLWIAREAGAGTPVRARLKVETPHGARTGPFRLLVADHVRVSAPLDGDLDVAGFARALPGLLERQGVTVGFENERYTLSLNGLKAALLKMDDLQGRVGTRGALVRKGANDERGVPDALRALHPHPAPNFALKSTDPALLRLVLPSLGADCNAPLKEGVDGADVAIHRVSDDQVIVLRECQRGAFQSAYAAWLVDDRPPYAARRLAFPQADGSSQPLAMNVQWEGGGGSLRSIGKGRAENDCGDDAFWTWTGHELELYNAHVEPLCRGMLGGGMTVRTFAYESK